MTLTDDQENFITSHISYIRRMSMLTDNQLRYMLGIKVSQDSELLEKFKGNEAKKQINELTEIAKNIKTDPLKIARKVA